MRLFGLFIFVVLILASCEVDYSNPGKPLIDLSFNGDVKNYGLANIQVKGEELVQYYSDEKDTCFNLSASAKYRLPLTISHHQGFSLNDYGGFTVSVWVQKAEEDPEEYAMISQQKIESQGLTGWEIKAEKSGSWSWTFKDTLQSWTYKPTVARQAINDQNWHHIAFSYNKQTQESRLYFDGNNVAIYSMWGNAIDIDDSPLMLGLSPSESSSEVEVFNGLIDDFKMWSRPLMDDEIKQVNFMRNKARISTPPLLSETLKVLTWSIWQGGVHEGKYVGKERIADVINSSGADIVMLQEMAGSGPMLADKLNFYYYQRSENLGVLSRYPLAESNNVYRTKTSGCVKVDLGEGRFIYACPIWLDPRPKMDAYFKSEVADPDSIVAREMESRGKEITFVLGEIKRLHRANKEVPILMGGGFNTGSHLDWTEENKVNYSGLVVPFPVSVQMERSGFKDAFRMIYPDEVSNLGHTWSTKFTRAFSDRKDYIYFIGDKLIPIESYVVEDHVVNFPSDHGAVITVFDWRKN